MAKRKSKKLRNHGKPLKKKVKPKSDFLRTLTWRKKLEFYNAAEYQKARVKSQHTLFILLPIFLIILLLFRLPLLNNIPWRISTLIGMTIMIIGHYKLKKAARISFEKHPVTLKDHFEEISKKSGQILLSYTILFLVFAILLFLANKN